MPPAQQRLVEFLEKKWSLTLDYFHIFLLGGTGSGKSTFLNLIAGREVVETGVVRPTTGEIQVYGHGSLAGKFDDLSCRYFPHDDRGLQDILIWDLPDMDSHCIAHHEASRLLREFADLLFIVLHPEKTRQKSLEEFLSWYPVIPQVSWITHSELIPPEELDAIEAQGWPGSRETFLVDLKKNPDAARREVDEVIKIIRARGFHDWKKETMNELSRKGLDGVAPFLERAQEDQEREKHQLHAMREFEEGANLRLEDSLWTIYREKVFGEIREKILTEVLFASRSYFSTFSGLLMKLSSKPEAALELPYMSLPLLRFEESVPGFHMASDRRDHFLDAHRELLLHSRVDLIAHSRTPSTWFFLAEILFDFLVPPALLVWFLLRTEPIPSDPLPTILLLLSLPVLFLFYWGRIQNRMKDVCRRGYLHYRQQVLLHLKSLLKDRAQELEESLELREKELKEMDQFLSKCKDSVDFS